MANNTAIEVVANDVFDVETHYMMILQMHAERGGVPLESLLEFLGPIALLGDVGDLHFDQFEEHFEGFMKLPPKGDHLVRWLEPVDAIHGFLQRFTASGRKRYRVTNVAQGAFERVEQDNPAALCSAPCEATIKSCDLKVAKPDVRYYHLAAEIIGVDPENILTIDDSSRNVRAARLAGWQAFHFDTANPEQSVQQLEEEYPDLPAA